MENLISANRELWFDWKWQLMNSLKRIEDIVDYFPFLKEDLENLKWVTKKYRFSVTPYYLSLAENDPDDPILKQIIPDVLEIARRGDPDPYREDEHSPVPHLVHRYSDRVVLLVTNICPVYCRHCMRKRWWRRKGYVLRGPLLEEALNYIRAHEEVKDVLLSGGEPLLLKDEELDYILSKLREIKHLKVLRIGSRVPVTLPMRLTESLGRVFEKYAPIYINTHFNHPRELSDFTIERMKNFTRYGVIWGNQTVLLKGVNDSVEILKELFYNLLSAGVRPYYLFQCDPVEGVEHFRVPLSRAIEIYRQLMNFSGMALPKFALDLPEGGGKVIISSPCEVRKMENGYLVRSNDRGEVFYPDPPFK